MQLDTPPATLRMGLLQAEAAIALGISIRSLRRWHSSGFGPSPVRDGNRLLYDPAALAAFKAGAR
jgi:DNA-binding transcriptional MerR regulator